MSPHLMMKYRLASFGGLRKGESSQPSSTTTVQKADPWEGQQPYLKDVFAEAQRQYQSGTPTYYQGQKTASVDPATLAAQQSLTANSGVQQGQADLTAATNRFNMTDARDVNTNPYLQSAIQAAIRPMVQNFNDAGGTMANIRSEGVVNQQGGGTRQGIAEGIAASRLNQQIGDVASTMASAGYQSGLDASGKAVALAPQVQAMQTAPAAALDAVGQQRQTYEQQQINDAIDQWNWEQNLPSAKLANYQNLVQGSYGGTGSSTSTGTTPTAQRNPLMGAVGGAMAGFQLGSMVPGIGGPIGAGVGALLSFL